MRSGKKVLIVDDEPNVVWVLKLMLERAGHKVRTAADGLQGLELLRAELPDVLITDIQMPRMDGRELVRSVHAEMPQRGFDIYVMTSMTEREERESALDDALEGLGRDYEMPETYMAGNTQNADYEEMVYGDTISFYDKLNEQLGELDLTDEQRDVMEYIIGSLDDDGLLRKDTDTISD